MKVLKREREISRLVPNCPFEFRRLQGDFSKTRLIYKEYNLLKLSLCFRHEERNILFFISCSGFDVKLLRKDDDWWGTLFIIFGENKNEFLVSRRVERERKKGKREQIIFVMSHSNNLRSLCFGYFCILRDMKVRLYTVFDILCD